MKGCELLAGPARYTRPPLRLLAACPRQRKAAKLSSCNSQKPSDTGTGLFPSSLLFPSLINFSSDWRHLNSFLCSAKKRILFPLSVGLVPPTPSSGSLPSALRTRRLKTQGGGRGGGQGGASSRPLQTRWLVFSCPVCDPQQGQRSRPKPPRSRNHRRPGTKYTSLATEGSESCLLCFLSFGKVNCTQEGSGRPEIQPDGRCWTHKHRQV